MSWIDTKYIGLISSRLRNFKRKSSNLYNMSCPFCGDSLTNKRKARGYFYEKDNGMVFHCHNCNYTCGFNKFLKQLDQNLFDEYTMEKFHDAKSAEQLEKEEFFKKLKKPKFLQSGPLAKLKKVSQLSVNDPIKLFVMKRKIPNKFHAKLFSCPNFNHFTNTILPNKFSTASLSYDETRLLIPLFDSEKNVFGYQGRSLNIKSEVKYITVMINDSNPCIFGLDDNEFNKTTYVMEGPIDSMFIPNSIATCGGDLVSSLKTFSKQNLVICYDNEPRSKETIKKLDKAILAGYNVIIWPDNFEHKDINDAIIAGLSSDFIEYIMKNNTYRELAALAALGKWSKI